MSHRDRRLLGTDIEIPTGVSIVDMVAKVGVFALSGAILLLGTVDGVPLSFYNAIIGSMIVGGLLLTAMDKSVTDVWKDFSY